MVNPYSAYRNQDLETSSKNELVGKLYESAALSLRKAAAGIGDGRLDLASSEMIHAQNIVIVLNDSLDMRYDISGQLRALYEYMLRRVREANIHKDVAILDEVAGMLSGLRDTWAQARKNSKIAKGINGGTA